MERMWRKQEGSLKRVYQPEMLTIVTSERESTSRVTLRPYIEIESELPLNVSN